MPHFPTNPSIRCQLWDAMETVPECCKQAFSSKVLFCVWCNSELCHLCNTKKKKKKLFPVLYMTSQQSVETNAAIPTHWRNKSLMFNQFLIEEICKLCMYTINKQYKKTKQIYCSQCAIKTNLDFFFWGGVKYNLTQKHVYQTGDCLSYSIHTFYQTWKCYSLLSLEGCPTFSVSSVGDAVF